MYKEYKNVNSVADLRQHQSKTSYNLWERKKNEVMRTTLKYSRMNEWLAPSNLTV